VTLYDIGCFWLAEVLDRKKAVLVGTTIMAIGAVI
jgi:hypothetical protein